MPTPIVSLSSLALRSPSAEVCVCLGSFEQGTIFLPGEQHWTQLAGLKPHLGGVKKLCKPSLNVRTPLHLFWRDKSVFHSSVFCSWLQFLTIHLPVISSIPEPYSSTQPEGHILTLLRQGQRRSKSCFLDQKQVLGCWMALALCIASLLLPEPFSHFVAMDNPPKPASSFHLLINSGQCRNTVDSTGNICPNYREKTHFNKHLIYVGNYGNKVLAKQQCDFIGISLKLLPRVQYNRVIMCLQDCWVRGRFTLFPAAEHRGVCRFLSFPWSPV